jgi:DNA primase
VNGGQEERVSTDVVARIKEALPLLEFLQRELELKREGTTFKAVCPFHSEKTGSFTVWAKTDSWHCFGCGKGGDLFTYYQERHNRDFKDALRELAREARVELIESPEVQAQVQRLRERSEILSAAARYYASHLRPEHGAYTYLRDKRGFTDEFVEAYGFGWAEGEGLRRALSGVPESKLKELGLLYESGKEFFRQRIVIPVYAHFGRDNTIVNLVGRFWSPETDQPEGKKYLRLPGEEQLINEGALRGAKEIYLCEGDTDTPTLLQAGLPVVGVPGSNALKPAFAEHFARVDTIFVCADSDVDKLGNKVKDAKGEQLIHKAGQLFGPRARIVELPLGEDVNSYVGQQGGDIRALAETARPYLEWLVSRLPAELPPDRADKVLEPVLAALVKFGRASQDLYAKQLAKRFGVTAAALKEAIREKVSSNGNGNGHDKDGTKLADSRIVWRLPRLVNPAQDLVDGIMLTTVFLDILEPDAEGKAPRIVTLPHVVTSRREVFPLSDAELWRRGWRFAPSKVPASGIIGRRWSTDEAAPHSVKAYVDDGATVNPWDLYQEVEGFLRRFVDYPNDLYYSFVALWVVASYWFNLFETFPYIHLTGAKRVGKTRTLEIIGSLAFNTLSSASLTPAAAFRAIESSSATLLIDEAENLQKRGKDDKGDDDKIEILKAGYKKGMKAVRCAGENNEPTPYDLYSPKVFGGTQDIDRILGDRVIPLILARRKRKLEPFNLLKQQPYLSSLRDRLYVFMLEYGSHVAEEIESGIRWEGVQDREEELWTPVLVTAQVIDKARLEEVADPQSVDPKSLLTYRMRTLARQKVEEKQAREQAEQAELLILDGTLDFLKHAEPAKAGTRLYSSAGLLEHLRQIEELGWLSSARQVIRQLEKVTAIVDRKTEVTRVRVGTKFVRVVMLDPERLEDLAARYGAGTKEEKEADNDDL